MNASLQIDDLAEFDDHKLITYMFNKKMGLKAIVAIHRSTNNHPAFGATRLLAYQDDSAALKDVLRLSRTMSYKSAMAGLKYGGAKGVIIKNGEIAGNRGDFFTAYAKCVNCLGGMFVTGCDVGVANDDVRSMRRVSKYIVGVKADPVRFTALGVYYTIETCLKEVFGSVSLDKRNFAIQGVGKTGGALLALLYPYVKAIYIADINKDRTSQIKRKYPRVKIVSPDKIHSQEVDVFSPCAMYHTLNFETIKKLNCKIIAGCANNQLENPIIDELLYKKGILYAPDYVTNAGGLISVVDEYEYGNHRVRRVTQRVEMIKNNIKKIIEESKQKNKPTNMVADKMAKELQANL